MFPAGSSTTTGGGQWGGAGAIKRAPGAGRKLPGEIAFLAQSVPASALATAVERARRLRVDVDRILICEGWIGEEDFYGHLGAHLGADFTQAPCRLRPDTDWRMALAAGMAQLEDGRWLLAPRGAAIAALVQRVSPRGGDRIVLTTPSSFERMVTEQFAGEIAAHAADRLAREKPHCSARSGANAFQTGILWLTFAMLPLEIAHGAAAWGLVLVLIAVVMIVAVSVRLAATLISLRPDRQPDWLSDDRLPAYSVLVPLYREAEIAPRLVAAMKALDYPAAKLEVIFLVEGDDEATLRALRAEHLPAHFRIIRVPDGSPRTKPRALNVGLLVARGELLVIYDAEDRPERDQLRKAAARFAARPSGLACLQASLRIENSGDSWLTRLFALDYAGQFEVLLRGMSAMALPLPLGGTSNHFRTSMLREAGGWDAWNVTEDADLGLRLARLGYRCETLASATWEEAPVDLKHWFPQRRRWLKGWMQTLITHTRRPFALFADLGPGRAMHAISLLASNTFGPAIGLWFTLYVLHDAYWGDLLAGDDALERFFAWLWTTLAGLGVLSIIAPTFVAIVKCRLFGCAPFLLLRPLHWLAISCAGVAAVYELWRRPFHWSKTRHGLSKSLPGIQGGGAPPSRARGRDRA